jgi:hypothetical protein
MINIDRLYTNRESLRESLSAARMDRQCGFGFARRSADFAEVSGMGEDIMVFTNPHPVPLNFGNSAQDCRSKIGEFGEKRTLERMVGTDRWSTQLLL